MTITIDKWSIEKDNTIGLFGRTNHSVLDLLLRIEQGIGNVNNDPNYTVAEMLNFCAVKNILNEEFVNEKLNILTKNYYFSNVIARASKTMLDCHNSKLDIKRTGTEG